MLSLAGEAFDYVHMNMREGDHRKPAFLAKQRFGQIPLLTDRTTGQHLCQSAAILEYLADALGKFAGASADERVQVREWLYWDFDRLSAPIYRARLIKGGVLPGGPEAVESYANEARQALKLLDDHLAGRNWVVGQHMTIADIDLFGGAVYAADIDLDLAAYPNVLAWTKRLEAQSGFGAPADLLPRETRLVA